MDTNESKNVINSGNRPSNAEYRCFDCGEKFKGYAESGSWMGSCPSCKMGMLLVITLNNESMNRDYFSGEE